MKAIVTSIKASGFGNRSMLCNIIDETGTPYCVESAYRFSPFEIVEVKEAGGTVEIQGGETYGAADREDYSKIVGKAVARVMALGSAQGSAFGGAELRKSVDAMRDSLAAAARRFCRALVTGTPVMVRFHGDGDGASGAVAMYRAVERIASSNGTGRISKSCISWRINKGIAYASSDLHSDMLLFDAYSCTEKPLVMIIDFGTSEESRDAIVGAQGKADLVWIDHHPIYEGFPAELISNYVNPWTQGYNSNTTAGFLACEMAEMISGIDATMLKGASLSSDHSSYADNSKEFVDAGIVIDAITLNETHGYERSNVTPKYIDGILNSKSRFDDVLHSASGQLDEAIGVAMKKLKRYSGAGGIEIFAFNYEHVAKLEFGYLKPGKFGTKLYDRIESEYGHNTLLALYYRNYVILRVSSYVSKRVGLLKIIGDFRELTDYVIEGGGHNEAASIRVLQGETRQVLNLLLGSLGCKPG